MNYVSPLIVRQRYEQVAATLESQIRSGTWPPGGRLPSERELAQRLGVSRSTIREALGALQVANLVETRQGAGSYVVDTLPARNLELSVLADASPDSLLQARAIFEPATASMAAAAIGSDPELERLLEVMADSNDPSDPDGRQRWSDADRAFHRQVAYATGNTVLIAVAEHVAELMDEPLWRRLRDDSLAVPGHTTLYLAEHRLIAAAIAEGDGPAAALHAAEHLKRARRYMSLID